MSTEITVTTKKGVQLKGDPKDVAALLSALGEACEAEGFYMSESKGLIKIKEMNTLHIKNAICKMYREWAAELNKLTDTPAFIAKLRTGPNSVTMLALIEEIATRKDPT